MFKKQTAQREQVRLMIGLTGPSGSGKTYSSLLMAHGITGDWTKIAVADTENKSAAYYAGERTGPWEHIPLDPNTMPNGYHPDNWLRLMDFVEADPSIDVLILDSISHEWEGQGGCLDLVDKIGKGFSGWKVVTPLHTKFIDRMRNSRLHVIATMRTKTEWVVEQNAKGKSEPRKIGLKANQREGTDYEFGVIFDLNSSHYATASKDRTGVFKPRGPFVVGADTGAELLAWANSGAKRTVETYTGTTAQKRRLFEIFEQLKVTDKKIMQKANAALIKSGVAIENLSAEASRFLEGLDNGNSSGN